MVNNVFSKNIKKFRESKKLSQTALAKKLFVTPQTVSKWENGISVPDIDNLCELSKILNISVDKLLGVEEKSRKHKKMIGIDGGGTKTVFVLFNEDGTVIRRIKLEASNPNLVGMGNALNVLKNGIDTLLMAQPDVFCLFAGLSGCAEGENNKSVSGFLAFEYPNIKSYVASDVLSIIAGVKGAEKCVAVICGTGSVVFGTDGEKFKRIGGNGYLFDDGGSGYDIGKDVIKHCVAVDEGFEEKGILTELATDKFGKSFSGNINELYKSGVDYIASFAPLAFTALKMGDKTAKKIVERNIKHIAKLINKMQSSFDCGDIVIFAGGLSNDIVTIKPILESELDKKSKIVIPELSPSFGACVKCMQLGGIKFDFDSFKENYEKTVI